MTSKDVRSKFLNFFQEKGHRIVPSAPIVVKDDPTLMFTNAGMNQFKDYFLGNKTAETNRVADTQKCLRVSGKHNDLEEVGVDTYHHTMFEMLGNWSFGDYFKKEAISWAWELLTEVYELDKDRLYVTVFGGDENDGLDVDTEAESIWKEFIPEDRILRFDRKDNFWEMGEVGPCGPCSEIHMDLRPDEERNAQDGRTLVNMDHEQVIELWNLVFIQYNRKADTSLEELPAKHIDTGMGLERIVRAISGKSSNYDIDLFTDTIKALEEVTGRNYGNDEETDIAFRVVADHIRALAFCIADGQLPSNTGAGYVLRRILRRAVRYGYSFLGLEKAFLHDLITVLVHNFKGVFPELEDQSDFVKKVIEQEEESFLRTLKTGMDRLDSHLGTMDGNVVDGSIAFELYDTYGFPVDLTQLIAAEKGKEVDMDSYQKSLDEQKARSKDDARRETGDWIVLQGDDKEEFVGYDTKETKVNITRYRTVKVKNKDVFQLVFNITPFYAESGGQIGDKGTLTGQHNNEVVRITDTRKENDLIIHLAEQLPSDLGQPFHARIDIEAQRSTARNHSATHLLHAALKQILGEHVNQKGSLVEPDRLRFDFSHFSKVTDEEIAQIETMVNEKIRESVPLNEKRNVPYQDAINSGVTALFGEKYGDTVRVITFDPHYSMELCGGIHVSNTADIGQFKIVSESAVAAGVRRMEAITGAKADQFVQKRLEDYDRIIDLLGNPKDPVQALQKSLEEASFLRKQLEKAEEQQVASIKSELLASAEEKGSFKLINARLDLPNAGAAKNLAFQLIKEIEGLVCVLAVNAGGNPNITVAISDSLVNDDLNASKVVRELARHIKGGGGGQPFFAQAGGKDLSGLVAVHSAANEMFT